MSLKDRVDRITHDTRGTKGGNKQLNVIRNIIAVGSQFNMSYREVLDLPLGAFEEYLKILIEQQEKDKGKKKTMGKIGGLSGRRT